VECKKPSPRYLIGANNCLTNLQVVESICDHVDYLLADGLSPKEIGRRRLIVRVEDRPGHDQRYAVNALRLKNDLGWQPRIGFEQGLRETVQWYLNHPEWVSEVSEKTASE